MIIFVDLDGTLCDFPFGHEGEYSASLPDHRKIDMVNKLYDQGHTIVIWTARGSTTHIDWTKLTLYQLEQWKVKYHELRIGAKEKPYFDMLIDDKAVRSQDLMKLTEVLCPRCRSETET